jgi:hypothetical protein
MQIVQCACDVDSLVVTAALLAGRMTRSNPKRQGGAKQPNKTSAKPQKVENAFTVAGLPTKRGKNSSQSFHLEAAFRKLQVGGIKKTTATTSKPPKVAGTKNAWTVRRLPRRRGKNARRMVDLEAALHQLSMT